MEEIDYSFEFKKKCIFDYTFFIASFFRFLDTQENKKYSLDASRFIINYLQGKKIEDLQLNNINRTNLNSLLKKNSRSFLSGQYFSIEKAGGSPKRKLPPSSINLDGISSHADGDVILSSKNQEIILNQNSNFSTRKVGRFNTNLFNLRTFKNNAKLLDYPNIFNNKHYNFFNQSTGVQSTMKVNKKNNPEFYFKKIDSNKPNGSHRALTNECSIFSYLLEKNKIILDNNTCFIKCFKNGILLKNGGSVLSSQLESKTFLFDEQNIKNLQNFFRILLELHKLLITHNDLKADNVVGFDKNHVRIIDFGQSEIHSEEYYDLFFFNDINRVFSKIFFSLLKKHRFIY